MKEKIKNNADILSIICYLISIIMYILALFIIKNFVFGIIGSLFFILGTILFIYNNKIKHKPLRKFEPVTKEKRKTLCCLMPTRSSENSAGYDFYASKDYTVSPNEIVKIWTDIKAFMQPDEFLMLDVRSSMGGKYMLANTIGIINNR